MSSIILIIICVSILGFLLWCITDLYTDMVLYKEFNECYEEMIHALKGKIKAQNDLIKSQNKYIEVLEEFINEHTKK